MSENRPIKFRVWNKTQAKWELPTRFNLLGQARFLSDDEFIFQQFTGLKDKNGKEIYEGDICKVKDIENQMIIRVITWGEYRDDEYVDRLECWMFGHSPLSCIINSNGVKYGRGFETKHHTLEIIGNIFENPELLTNKKDKWYNQRYRKDGTRI